MEGKQTPEKKDEGLKRPRSGNDHEEESNSKKTKVVSFSVPSNDVDTYVSKTNEAIRVVYVSSQDLSQESLSFHPLFTHQFFGEDEEIKGYKGLSIRLTLSPSFFLLIQNKYEAKDKEADDVTKLLSPWKLYVSDEDYTLDTKVFKKGLQDKLKPSGTLLEEYKSNMSNGEVGHFQIYWGEFDSPDIKRFHKRAQLLSLLLIDGASPIQLDDKKWTYFYLFWKRQVGSDEEFLLIGYCTAYRFFSFPDKTRLRISQFMIIPSFQKMGHGRKLLQGIWKKVLSDPNIRDLTIEEPSPECSKLRDLTDLSNAYQSKSFDKYLTYDRLSDHQITEIQQITKMAKPQIRRIFEILRLSRVSSPTELKKFRLDIKRRLYKQNNNLLTKVFNQKMAEDNQVEDPEAAGNGDNNAENEEKPPEKTTKQELDMLYKNIEADYSILIGLMKSASLS